MSTNETEQPRRETASRVQGSVRIIKPCQFDSNTPQTPGMQIVPHQEMKASPDTPSQWVIVRNAQEPIVVNLEPLDAPQQEVTR